MTTDMSEQGLETLIERSLIEQAGYLKGKPSDYVREFCFDKVQLLEFLRTTQPQAVKRLATTYGEHFEERLFKRISDQIKAKGIVEVLRKGIKAQEVSLTLYYKQPASQLNPDATARYETNCFSVTRQLRYSNDNKQLALDLVIFINGLPLITFELKNQVTGQSVKDAMRQYQKDRVPKALLFQFSRCLVHFAVDDELVYMTTHLKGEATRFLPFNQGRKSSPDEMFPDSAGNPANPNGIITDYLSKQILTKPSLSNIIREFNEHFGNIDWTDEDKVRRLLFEVLPREVSQDEEYLNAKQHSDRQNARITFEKKLTDKFQDHIFDQTEAYRQYTDNQEFKEWLVNKLFEINYDHGLNSLKGE